MLSKKIVSVFVLSLAVFLSCCVSHGLLGSSSLETTVQVEPPEPIVPVCENFMINITVILAQSQNLYWYQFELHYDSTILEALGVNYSIFGIAIPDIDNGVIKVDEVGTKAGTYVSGNVPTTLATIELRSISLGESVLELQKVELKNTDWEEISPREVDGSCTVIPTREGTIAISEDYILCHNTIFHGTFVWFAIEVDNVVLDLNGCTISSDDNYGIAVEVKDKTNVTIKNGTYQIVKRAFAR